MGLFQGISDDNQVSAGVKCIVLFSRIDTTAHNQGISIAFRTAPYHAG